MRRIATLRGLLAAAWLLLAAPLGAQGPAPSPGAGPFSQILAVSPTVVEAGEEVRISLREGALLEGLRRDGWAGFTVTIGGRLAPITGGSPSGVIAVRAPAKLAADTLHPVVVVAFGERAMAEDLIAVTRPTIELFGISISTSALVLVGLVVYAAGGADYVIRRSRFQKDAALRSAEQAQAEAEKAARLRFALDRLQQGDAAAPPVTEPSAVAPLPDIPPALAEALAAGRCTLFWGSGLSAQAGYPTWGIALPELLRQIAGRKEVAGLDLDRLARDRPALALEVILAKLGEATTLEMLRPLWDGAHAPTESMRQLAGMPFANVVTSAWDWLPAEVFAHRSPQVLSRLDAESLAPLLRGDTFCVLHIWGAFDRGRVLLTETDYRATITGNPVVARHIASLLQAQTHLFIGASLASIEQYLVTAPPASEGRPHYALVPADPQIEAMREVMRSRYRLELLVFRPTPDWSGVPRFVEALRGKLGSTRPPARAAAVEKLRIERVELENIGPFEKARLDLDPAWNVLLGDNGAGKSMVLRAIALGLCGDDTRAMNEGARLLRNGAKEGHVQLTVGGTSYLTRLLRQDGGVEVRLPAQVSPLAAGRWAVLGFPALRGLPGSNPLGPTPESDGASPRVEDVLPILTGEPDVRLRSLRQWLVNLEVGADPERAARLRARFFDVLNAFLPGLTIRYGGVDRRTWSVQVEVNVDRIPLDQVSQGTGAMFGWIGALLLRMQEIHGDALLSGDGTVLECPAVVLIDEIDAHLHPAWQQRIVPELRRQFPQVQFIASTHSPLIVAELAQRQVFRMRRANGAMMIDHPAEGPAGLGVAGLLTSDAFALTRVLDSHTHSLLERQRALAAKATLTAGERQELEKLGAELSDLGFGAQIRDEVFARYLRARERRLRETLGSGPAAELSDEEAERLVALAIADDPATGGGR